MNDEVKIDDIIDDFEKRNYKKKFNSKKKGSRGELKICKILSNHFHKNFNRVPHSGAFGTTHSLEQNARNVLSGDIICPENFLFTIEAKSGYNIDLFNIFNFKNNWDKKLVMEFINQSIVAADRCKSIPMVIYNKDRRPCVAIVPISGYKESEVIINNLYKFSKYMILNYKLLNYLWDSWIIVNLEEFLSIIPEQFFYKAK
jgi:hypothetical protein